MFLQYVTTFNSDSATAHIAPAHHLHAVRIPQLHGPQETCPVQVIGTQVLRKGCQQSSCHRPRLGPRSCHVLHTLHAQHVSLIMSLVTPIKVIVNSYVNVAREFWLQTCCAADMVACAEVPFNKSSTSRSSVSPALQLSK